MRDAFGGKGKTENERKSKRETGREFIPNPLLRLMEKRGEN